MLQGERSKKMKPVLKKAFQMSVLVCLLTLASAFANAQDSSPQQPAPDNTKTNQRDKNKAEPTADQQKENQSDRELTQQIRRAIVQDKSLSSYAHNVKIISEDGMVTLKGPVRSEEEKTVVEAKASEIAGKDKVTSQLEVKPKQ
jgi:hyperosmotically inducible periplasmic protein